MQIMDELKRMLTKEFWKQVGYWSAIKWTGKKTETVEKEDWLPILTSAAIGILIIIGLILISKYIFQ